MVLILFACTPEPANLDCEELTFELARDEESAMGLSGDDVLAEVEGDHVWQGTWTDDAEAALSMSVTGGTTRYIRSDVPEDAEGFRLSCPDRLEVDVDWTLASDDGLLDEAGAGIVFVLEGATDAPWLTADIDAIAGALDPWAMSGLDPEQWDDDQLWLDVIFGGNGVLSHTASRQVDEGVEEGVVVDLLTWSTQPDK